MGDGTDVYAVFLAVLERQGISYFVTGSVASSAYGEPRFTQGLDLVVALPIGSISHLVGGFPSRDFYVPPESTLREEVSRSEGGHFKLVHHESGVRADVYLAGGDHLHAWAFRHREDVRNMVRVCGELLDRDFLTRQLGARGLDDLWKSVQDRH